MSIKIKRILSVFLIVLLLLTGCNKTTSNTDDLESIMNEGNYIIIDVRTNEEYKQSHIVGSINIPYDEIDGSFNLDKNKKILVYCQSGNRSKKAYDLTALGYSAYDLGAFSKIDLPKE